MNISGLLALLQAQQSPGSSGAHNHNGMLALSGMMAQARSSSAGSRSCNRIGIMAIYYPFYPLN